MLFAATALDQNLAILEPKIFGNCMDALQVGLDAIGIVTHHDAITGTSKEYVVDDYSVVIKEA